MTLPGDLCVPKLLTSPSISLKGDESEEVTEEGDDSVTSFGWDDVMISDTQSSKDNRR